MHAHFRARLNRSASPPPTQPPSTTAQRWVSWQKVMGMHDPDAPGNTSARWSPDGHVIALQGSEDGDLDLLSLDHSARYKVSASAAASPPSSSSSSSIAAPREETPRRRELRRLARASPVS